MIKKVSYKLILLVIIVTSLNFIYVNTNYKNQLKRNSPCAYQCQNLPEGTDVVYFGESSNTTYAEADSTKLTISELVKFYNPKLNLVTIDTMAVHAGIYKYWLKEMYYKPKAVIITMNLRSFSASWIHSSLETQLIRSVRLSRPEPKIWNRFLLSLKNFEDKTEAELDSSVQKHWREDSLIFPFKFRYQNVKQWDLAMGSGGWLKPDGSWDMEKSGLATHYIKAYAFNLNEKNPRVRDFDEIMLWSKKNGVKVLFNLLSENVAFADSLVGKELVYLMRTNKDFLVNRYRKMGAVVVDNFELVDKTDFIDKNWTTEHYTGRGRMRIAKSIVSKLN